MIIYVLVPASVIYKFNNPSTVHLLILTSSIQAAFYVGAILIEIIKKWGRNTIIPNHKDLFMSGQFYCIYK